MAFGKSKKGGAEQTLAGVLNALDTEILVLRGKGCGILFANSAAQKRLGKNSEAAVSCADALANSYPDICRVCPGADVAADELPFRHEVKDKAGQSYLAEGFGVLWTDDKPALLLTLRNVDEESKARQKLYDLAYIDQLTGVSNRQRFREDFEAVAGDIAAGRLYGVVAIFDLDNFKNVNDTYGHSTGDVMLRRLTEHLKSVPEYRGHLYRLGGDEFVFFFTGPPSSYGSEEAFRGKYIQLFKNAFLAYTMPNIDISCTISMGAALFPRYGENSSELLRKADIALYQAKAAGKNRLVFFEDQYDTAKKFKDLYINIQPILTAHGTTYGYELVDRGDEGKDAEDTLNLSDFDRTMDAISPGELDGSERYFVAFTNQFTSGTVLNNLPKDKFVVQIHLGESPPTAAELLKYKQLRVYGYALAASGLSRKNHSPDLMALADYVKFSPGADMAFQKRTITEHSGKRFVALGVDSGIEFETAKSQGFKLFQGYFFNQPVVVKKTKDIDPMRANYLRLLKLTSTKDYVNFHEISTVISSDVALSYKLLRLLNSAAVGLKNKVSSIDMAVAYLGEESLKKWVALLALRGIGADKPLELVRMSLIRAQFGELLAPAFKPPRDVRYVFLTGLFSLLHVALEKSKEELFEEIPVADVIRESIMTQTGPHSDLLAFFTSYEYANWDEVSAFVRENGLNDRLINDAYISAVKWYNDLARNT